MLLIGGNHQVGLGFEKVIKAALVDAGARADLFDPDRAIALLVDQVESH